MKAFQLIFLVIIAAACAIQEKTIEQNLSQQVNVLPSIDGKSQYLTSPFVTAGNRVYMVGFQNGTFPDLGWHIDGEMGGIWDHPIKLMDGFSASVTTPAKTYCLDSAVKFTNYPVGNKHIFVCQKDNLKIERFQFVPDDFEGIVVEFRIQNTGSSDKDITFNFTGKTDLRPTWLGERTSMIDGMDSVFFDQDLGAFVGRDVNNPWYVTFGTGHKSQPLTHADDCQPVSKGNGQAGTISVPTIVKAGSEITLPFFIAGSYQGETAARKNYSELKSDFEKKLQEKISRFNEISNTSKLTILDKDVEQMYQWLKYNTDWLVRSVPESGTGLSAGLPDYPWWFGCDNAYALQGVLATGDHALVKKTIMLLNDLSKKTNGNGRIVHEVSTNGAVYNPGNVNETAQFISLLLHYYHWTGDKALIEEIFPEVEKGITWLTKDRDPDGNGYPNGSGMMEIPGLDTEMIDVAVYTQDALRSASVLAKALGKNELSTRYADAAEKLKRKINAEWWQDDAKSFGDFRGTPSEAKPVIEAAIVRADTLEKPWAVAELKASLKNLSGYPAEQQMAHVVYHNWVVNTPMEMGIADDDKATAALQTAKTFENPFGVFVTGTDRTEEADSVVLKSRKKIFSYVGAVMTLPTGVQAIANARYATPEESRQYLRKLHQSFSYALPGSMYEVSPDFGMFTQAWNIYSVAVPIVNHFFGISPRADEKIVMINPRMPKDWNAASLENVTIGNNSVSIYITQSVDEVTYRFQQKQNDWEIHLGTEGYSKAKVNGKDTDVSGGQLTITGNEISVQLSH